MCSATRCLLLSGDVEARFHQADIVEFLRYQLSWTETTQLHLNNVKSLYSYSSSPEAGMPSLPFEDSSIRRSADEPWFVTGYNEG